MKTIGDVEGQVEERVRGALEELHILPAGYRCSVRLHGKERDKKRTASFETSWSPETDSICIRFERTSEETTTVGSKSTQSTATVLPERRLNSTPATSNPLSDLIRALDRAESQPGYKFVALKWFRDTALPSEEYAWANDDSARRSILREAIDRRLVLTNSVPNPKSPQFPVTAIRLNRLMPEVKAILGSPAEGIRDFQPAAIRGGNLSATVLGDRR
jgi:hypothetical protein